MSRSFLPALLTLLALVAGCTTTSAGDAGAPPGSAPGVPRPVDFEAPQIPLDEDRPAGDGTDQKLTGVAADGRLVVAVGARYAANTSMPLFLASRDAGRTWKLGATRPGAEPMDSSGAVAAKVAIGPAGIVAVGRSSADTPVVWRSEDGLTWDRLESPAFSSHEWVSAVRVYGDTYYLAGGDSRAQGRATSRAVLWTSRDLVTWTRMDLSERGLGKLAGSPGAADVAVVRRELVVAVEVGDETVSNQPDRIQMWRSRDAGRRFTMDLNPPDFAGEYRAYVGDLTVHDGAVHLAASGDGADTDDRSSWDAVVLRAEGRGWSRAAAPAAFGTDAQEHPSTLVRAGGTWVLAGHTADGSENAVVAAGADLRRLRPVTGAGLGGPGVQAVEAGVAVGSSVVLVGSDASSGSVEPAVWTVARGRAQRMRVPAEARDGRPTAWVSDLVRSAGKEIAVGAAADDAVAWSAAGGGPWRPESLWRSSASPSASVSAATALPGGGVLAVGHSTDPLGGFGAAWTLRHGTWRNLADSDLSVKERGYGDTSLDDVAVGRRLVVIAANAYDGNRWSARPLVAPATTLDFTAPRGVPTKEVTPFGVFYIESGKRPEFVAPPNGSVWMSAVAATARGFLIGGHRSPAGDRLFPVVWSSRDGAEWSDPVGLPLGAGVHAAQVTHIGSAGSTVVVTGTHLATAGQEHAGWMSWVSTDSGRTWTTGRPVVEAEAAVSDLVRTPSGWLALGSVGRGGTLDAAAWKSADGRSWTPVTLPGERSAGVGDQRWAAGLVVEDRLRLIGSDVPPEGGGFYAAEVPLGVIR